MIKAVARAPTAADFQDLERFRTSTSTCSTRRRAACAAARGRRGTGRSPAGAARTVPLILSGGLTAENVADGIAAVDPYAVDVASGVEASPGVKDPDKLRAFIGPRAAAAWRSAVVTTAVEHRFGPYGGQYVPETLMPALAELEAAWVEARADAGYRDELAGCDATSAAARRRSTTPSASPRPPGARSGSSART